MCEPLATKLGNAKTESYFLTGLFSSLDALLDISINEALAMLPICDEVVEAISGGEGNMGKVLKCAIAYETGCGLVSILSKKARSETSTSRQSLGPDAL